MARWRTHNRRARRAQASQWPAPWDYDLLCLAVNHDVQRLMAMWDMDPIMSDRFEPGVFVVRPGTVLRLSRPLSDELAKRIAGGMAKALGLADRDPMVEHVRSMEAFDRLYSVDEADDD